MSTDHLCMGCMEQKGPGNSCPHCGWIEGAQPESPLHLPPGTILVEKYLLGRVLGQGGFGITYLAWDIFLERKLAVKEFFPRDFCYRESGYSNVSIYAGTTHEQYDYGLDKFLTEGKTLARFDGHPNIVSVRDFFKANETAYLVMSYLDGATLCSYLESKNEQLEYEETMQIIIPVLDALRAVHDEGLLHRDISPDNIMITAKGQIVILDFGAARHAIGEKGKQFSIVLKPGYAPEEQYRSNGLQGPWTDIYATGATMYRALTGYMPPESLDRLSHDTLVPPSELGVAMPYQQEHALLISLAVKAENRFQCIKDFQSALMAGPGSEPAVTGSGFPEEVDTPVHPEPYPEAATESYDQTPEGAGQENSKNAGKVEKPGYEGITVKIGRASTNDLVLDENTVSRHHASIFFQNGSWQLKDLNSTHGTKLNDVPVSEQVELPAESWISVSAVNLFFNGSALFSKSGECLLNFDTINPLSPSPRQGMRANRHTTTSAPNRNNKRPVLYLLGIAGLAAVIVPLVLYFSGEDDATAALPRDETELIEEETLEASEVPIEPLEVEQLREGGEEENDYATIEFENGTYTGEVKNGLPHGYGVFIFKEAETIPSALQSGDHKQYEGYWKEGKMHGEGKITYPDGHTRTGTWQEGLLTTN